MKRTTWFLMVSGWVSLIANVLGILGHFSGDGAFADLALDGGLLAAGSFLTLGYALVMWSAWSWRRVRVTRGPGEAARSAAFMLDALAALPVLTLWLYLLEDVLLLPLASAQRWMMALGLGWFFTPFAALGLMVLGEILGPLLTVTGQEGED
jgi:hypothetical protein